MSHPQFVAQAATHSQRPRGRLARAPMATLMAMAFFLPAAGEDDAPESLPALPAASASPSAGQTFETAEAAAARLVAAYEKNDDNSFKSLMGPGNDDIVQDGRDPTVRTYRAAIAAAAQEKLLLEKQADGRILLVVGSNGYPLPLSLVSTAGKWRVDAAAGRQELLARRIGENEIDAICIALSYADAQVAYAAQDRNDDGVKEYAQLLASTPGQRDGLYWDAAEAGEQSPAGPGLTPLVEARQPEGSAQPPYGGYYWRVLTAQGPSAPGGEYSYVINGRMIAGFALLAVPASYRTTGVASFLVSNHGKVYEADLGPDTLEIASKIEVFNPDDSWQPVDEDTLRDAAATFSVEETYAHRAGPDDAGPDDSDESSESDSASAFSEQAEGLPPTDKPGPPCDK